MHSHKHKLTHTHAHTHKHKNTNTHTHTHSGTKAYRHTNTDTQAIEVHCVYIPNGIPSIVRTSLLLQQKRWKCIVSIFRMASCLHSGCHLCLKKHRKCIVLYSGCHFVYIPDVSCGSKQKVKVHCVYIPDAIFVYIPDVTFDSKRKWKCIVSIFRIQFCLYSGCHFFWNKTMKVHGAYIPDAISSIFRVSLLIQNGSGSALCVYSGCHFLYVADVIFA